MTNQYSRFEKMINIIVLELLLYINAFFLTIFIVFLSKRGYLGNKLFKFSVSDSLFETLIVSLIIFSAILWILHFISVLVSYSNSVVKTDIWFGVGEGINNNINTSNTNPQDPVRLWPSGTIQSWGIIGTALAVHRLTPGSPKVKAIAALSTLPITIPSAVYFHAVENPVGFREFFYTLSYRRMNGGRLPNSIPKDINQDEIMQTALTKHAEEAQNNFNSTYNSDATKSSFWPDNNLFEKLTPDNFINYLLDFFKPVAVEGHLDDLLGLHLFIHILLLMIVVGLISLFTIYFIIPAKLPSLKTKNFFLKGFKINISYFL